MSDLAPFVAAAIKDKVVEDLAAENAQLQTKVANSQRFQVTGYLQQEVFAEGTVEGGHFHPGNSNLWVIPFTSVKKSIPWREFKSLEIYIGGVQLLSNLRWVDYNYMLYFSEGEELEDDEIRVEQRNTSAKLTFNYDHGEVRLNLIVQNFPPEALAICRRDGFTDSQLANVLYRARLFPGHYPTVTTFEITGCAIVSLDRVFGLVKASMPPNDPRGLALLAQSEMHRALVFQIRLVLIEEVENFDETDGGWIQTVSLFADELAAEGHTCPNTDAETAQFRRAVLEKMEEF